MTQIVVAYDISNDRRRARLHTLLLGYGEPVQESLFECDLDDADLRKLRHALRRLVRPADAVRLYALCGACAGRIQDGQGRPVPRAPEVYLA